MKAIETEYAGVRFRSRLEARWAVFFDALGIRWEYEPEAFVLSDGSGYTPDFLLPGLQPQPAILLVNAEAPTSKWRIEKTPGVYVEVKPETATLEDWSKIDRLLVDRSFRIHTLRLAGPPACDADATCEKFWRRFGVTRTAYLKAARAARGHRFWDPQPRA